MFCGIRSRSLMLLFCYKTIKITDHPLNRMLQFVLFVSAFYFSRHLYKLKQTICCYVIFLEALWYSLMILKMSLIITHGNRHLPYPFNPNEWIECWRSMSPLPCTSHPRHQTCGLRYPNKGEGLAQRNLRRCYQSKFFFFYFIRFWGSKQMYFWDPLRGAKWR